MDLPDHVLQPPALGTIEAARIRHEDLFTSLCSELCARPSRRYNWIQYVAIYLAARHGGVKSDTYIKHVDARLKARRL
jgi:hypothetical protein